MYAYCRNVQHWRSLANKTSVQYNSEHRQHSRSLANKTSVQYQHEHKLPGKRIPTNRILNPLVETPYLAEELEMCEHVVRGARRPVELVSFPAFLVLTPISEVCDAGFCIDGPFPDGCTQLQTKRQGSQTFLQSKTRFLHVSL